MQAIRNIWLKDEERRLLALIKKCKGKNWRDLVEDGF
tara:strand:- start:908 stop:1018 length:111 start_codon:yes stop_codon:yes gene_type:complete